MILNAAQMVDAERAAFAAGESAEGLMEIAGRRLAEFVHQFHPRPGTCRVFAGKGHNGGDVLVAARYLADVESAAAIGTRAGQRAISRLHPIKLASGPMPILFDPRVSSTLLGHLVGAITGSAIARGTSFLKDKLGQAILPAGLSIIDDPLRRRGLRSRAFDGEGLAAQRTAIIEQGVPMFGICLGHQLMALALGGKTFKLPFGHHGANHPVRNLRTGSVEITSQNHNFCVDPASLSGVADITHTNLNDQTNEGMRVRDVRAFSVQYHPEAGPGPHDSRYLFNEFAQLMGQR